MKTVCWNGIVKNESAVIERCMLSMVGHIDYWVIVDTGSTDGTQDLIRNFMERFRIPGELHQRPWVNFSHNRSEALELAEGKADYVLLCDADMALKVKAVDWKDDLNADVYLVKQKAHGMLSYRNARLVNARLKGAERIRYWSSTHEYMDSIGDSVLSRVDLNTISMLDFGDGGSKHDKFERDERLLLDQITALEKLDKASEEQLKEAQSSGLLKQKPLLYSRSFFYLGRTYFDINRYEEAIEAFQRRVDLGGWQEEVWFSLLTIAECKEQLNASEGEIVDAYLMAYQYRPSRSEPLYQLARRYRIREEYAKSYLFAKQAAVINYPSDKLFVRDDVYAWRVRDELAISAYWAGNYDESIALCDAILELSELSDDVRARIQDNRQHAVSGKSRSLEQD